MTSRIRKNNKRVRKYSQRRLGGEQLESRNLMTAGGGDVAMEEMTLSCERIDEATSAAEEAYFVKVDAETTTENADNSGSGDFSRI